MSEPTKDTDENGFEVVKLPGDGLSCGACGAALPQVARTVQTSGMIVRDRDCGNCGERNTTAERVIATRPVRGYNRRLCE